MIATSVCVSACLCMDETVFRNNQSFYGKYITSLSFTNNRKNTKNIESAFKCVIWQGKKTSYVGLKA